MPITRRQAAEERRVGVALTLEDTARRITRVSGSIHSIANLIGDTMASRPGFKAFFENAGSRSSATARAIWRFHDRRWTDRDEDREEEDDEDERPPIDDEVDQRLGVPFNFRRAMEVGLEYIAEAKEVLQERKAEMEAWADQDGAQYVDSVIEQYKTEKERWQAVQARLLTCSTTLGESLLDSSLRYGWV